MYHATLVVLVLAGTSIAQPGLGDPTYAWQPARPNDYRGPCPMMNTMANHGYIPRDGRNITRQVIIAAMSAALNFNASLATVMFDHAVIANPEPNSAFFSLDDLNRHNVLEHDASLSRSDAFFGNNHVFNQTIFDETKTYWTAPILTAQMLANGKLARQISSRAYNPNYTFTAITEQFSLGEVAAPVIAFGDMESVTVNKTLVEYFFENERLPTELGWTRKTRVVSLEDILAVQQAIGKATNLQTGMESRPNLHAGDATPPLIAM